MRIVYRDFPLGMHKRAAPASEAALCAHEQDKFWPYHDKLMANQRSLSDEDLKKYAEELGLEMEKWTACYDSGKYRDDVMEDMREGQQAGVTGTPAFFVNGRFLSGAQPFEAFKTIIEDELDG